jgi:hypothetical protein
MLEEAILKTLGLVGIAGVLADGILRIYRGYRKEYSRPHSVLYRRDLSQGEQTGEDTPTARRIQ